MSGQLGVCAEGRAGARTMPGRYAQYIAWSNPTSCGTTSADFAVDFSTVQVLENWCGDLGLFLEYYATDCGRFPVAVQTL